MFTASIPTKQQAVLFRENGGTDKILHETDFPVPEITKDTEIIVKNAYAGINFIESYFRLGIYPSQMPYVMGTEASGVVVAKGSAVTNVEVGDKIAYMGAGSFAQYTKQDTAVAKIMKLEVSTTDEDMKKFASVFVNGLTALAFTNETYHVKKGDYILVHAIAGGTGLFFAQLIKRVGGIVIGTASSDEKLALGKEYGADYLINSKTQDIVAEVKKITNGAGVAAVYDGIGKETMDISLDCVARKGTFVTYGNASGVPPPLSLLRLTSKCIKVARPQSYGYITTPEEWEFYTSELKKVIAEGLKVNITETYELKDYKQATEKLESRQTTGKLVLAIP